MKIFTTGDVYPSDLVKHGQKMLDDLDVYLRSRDATIEDVRFLQTESGKFSIVLTAIAP